MIEMHTDLPKTINEALKILAYNDYFWNNDDKAHIVPHPKDKDTVRSLAEANYAWTEKQAKLALVILKRYHTKFQKHNIDLTELLQNPKYDEPFRIMNFEKCIEKWIDEDGNELIDLKFPYNKKVVTLIRCLKDKKLKELGYSKYDGDRKIWTFTQTDVTTYYLTLIAIRYDFKIVDESLLNDYDEIKKEIIGYRKPSAKLVGGQIILSDASESLLDYWKENLQDKKLVQQLDALKNLKVDQSNIEIQTETYTAKKIAESKYTNLWIDNKEYSKDEVIAGLKELDAFPIIMPVAGEISSPTDIGDFWEWIKAFERNGIDILNEMSWGFDLKEPRRQKDADDNPYHEFIIGNTLEQGKFDQLFEMHQMSKQFKYIDTKTKVLFVRNRIPRSLMKSKIKPKASLVTLGGGYYSAGTDNLKRFLDNLPKKLYYSDSQPSSWEWRDSTINKL